MSFLELNPIQFWRVGISFRKLLCSKFPTCNVSMASLQFEWQLQLGFKYISFVKSTMKIGFLYFLHNNTSPASVSSSIVHIGLCCCLRSNVRFVLAVASVVWTSTRLAVSQYTRWVIDFSIIKRPSTERELSSYEAMLCYEKKEWICLVYYCNRM